MIFQRKAKGFDRPCAGAEHCSRFDPGDGFGQAILEIKGILESSRHDAMEIVDDDKQHRLKHEALGRVAVLNGCLRLVAHDLENCTCGALTPPVAELLAAVMKPPADE